MRLSTLLLFIVGVSFGFSIPLTRDRNKKPFKVICYFGSKSFYRSDINGKLTPEQINPNICTHIHYGFAKLENNTMTLFDPDLDTGDTDKNSGLPWGHGLFRRVNTLRSYNKFLTTLISIGGWDDGSDKYSMMVRDPASRRIFIQSTLDFLEQYDFDGLDLVWQYPGMSASNDTERKPGRSDDKQDFMALVRELREQFMQHGYVLSVAVAAKDSVADRAYDIPQLTHYVDYVNLMSFDFHDGSENKTGHHSALYPLPWAQGDEEKLSVQYAVDYWLGKGMEPQKLVLGIPLYGRSFTLASNQTGIGAPTTGNGGNVGPITKTIGMLGHNEICSLLQQKWSQRWHDIQKVPYAFHGDQWVGFENPRSVLEKSRFVRLRKLGGAMVWSVDTDDFTGHCVPGKLKYPLLKVISKDLNDVAGPDTIYPERHVTQSPKPTSSTPTPTPTQTSPTPTQTSPTLTPTTTTTTRDPTESTTTTTVKPIF